MDKNAVKMLNEKSTTIKNENDTTIKKIKNHSRNCKRLCRNATKNRGIYGEIEAC